MPAVPEIGDLSTEADKFLTALAERLTQWRAHQPGDPLDPAAERAASSESEDGTTAGRPSPAAGPDTSPTGPTASHQTPPHHTAADQTPPDHTAPDHTAAAPACTSCPWCRLQTAWRQQRPEVTAALVEAASIAVAALQTVLHSPPLAPENAHSEPAGPGGLSGDPDQPPSPSPSPSQSPARAASQPATGSASTPTEETTLLPAAADGPLLQRIPIR